MKNILVLLIIMFLCSACAADTLQYVGETTETVEPNYEIRAESIIKVHVCGEVYFPGVYSLYSGSRIYELVQQAGGFTAEADTEAVNQAKEVFDAEQIYIPSIKEREESENGQGLIDLNKATEAMLCTIPGIGAQRAKQIIDYREKNGRFNKIEDIMKISGIKEGMFEKIAPYITVS